MASRDVMARTSWWQSNRIAMASRASSSDSGASASVLGGSTLVLNPSYSVSSASPENTGSPDEE